MGFNGIPDFIVKNYEINKEAEEVRINEIIIDYEINTNSPYWNAYVIIEHDISPDKIKKWVKRLYESVKFLLNNAKDTFDERVDSFSVPDDDKLNKILCNDFHIRGEGVSIKQEEFFNTVINQSMIYVEQLINENKLNMEEWDRFIGGKDINEALDSIIKKLTILNMHDGRVDFKIKNNYVKTLDTISIKLANNLFYEFKKLHGDDKNELQQ